MESARGRPLATFLLVAFGGSIALSLAVRLTGGRQSPYIGVAPIAMLFPALALLLTRVLHRQPLGDLGWRRFPVRYLPLAVLLMPLAIHLVALPGVVLLEGRTPWVSWLSPSTDGLFHPPPDRGWGELTAAGLAARIVLNAAVGLLVVSVLAFFEEVGWRAWLLPRLAERLGDAKAMVATAAIWAAWHSPFAWSGIHAVENVSAVAVGVLMPLGHFGAALVLSWLWLRTRSVWIVTLSHGALNNWGQLAFKYMKSEGGADLALLVLLNGTLLAVGLATFFWGRGRAAVVAA